MLHMFLLFFMPTSDCNLTDASLARSLMHAILARVDSPSALSDGLLIVAAYSHLSAHEAYALARICVNTTAITHKMIRIVCMYVSMFNFYSLVLYS
jgi:hypothetical protein